MALNKGLAALYYSYSAQLLVLIATYKKLKERKKKKIWIRKIFQFRHQYGFGNTLIPQLRNHDQEYYFQFMRMTPVTFENILQRVGRLIEKKTTRWREPISPRDRLAITLRFLASGETYRSLSYAFRVGRSTISHIVKSTCQVIWENLKDEYMVMPKTPEEWQIIADAFEKRWQLPHCVGSIDGKHVYMECPKNTGTLNYNYKGTFSKVLLAVSDSAYKFLFVDFGHYGSESDGGIFRKCIFGKRLLTNAINLPPPALLPKSNIIYPYFFIGDEAFPLKTNLMRPYPRKSNFNHNERIYNYRLSRARRVVENAFGILSARFRIFKRPLNYGESAVPSIVSAALVLHNYLLTEVPNTYCPVGYADREDANHNLVPGQWRDETNIPNLNDRLGSNMYSQDAKVLRDKLAKYLNEEGEVPWQNDMVYRGLPP